MSSIDIKSGSERRTIVYSKIEWVHWITANNTFSKSHAFKDGAEDAMCGEWLPKSSVISIRETDDTCKLCTTAVSKLRREECA